MNAFEYQPEPPDGLNDELLSAYLDGELTVAERVEVEGRLASDPAARQLLEELRAVSQAIHSAMAEPRSANLHESILERIAALPANAPARRSDSSNARLASRRTWVWASLAVAAGLLIMVFQPGGDQTKELPAVAHNTPPMARETVSEGTPRLETQSSASDPNAADTVGDHLARGGAGGRALTRPSTPTAPPIASVERAEERIARSSSNEGQLGAPQLRYNPAASAPGSPAEDTHPNAVALKAGEASPSKNTPAALGRPARNEPVSGVAPQISRGLSSLSRSGNVASAPPPSPVLADSEKRSKFFAEQGKAADGTTNSQEVRRDATRNDDGLIVVHVLANSVAVESRAFDRVLEENGIEIDRAAEGRSTVAAAVEGEATSQSPRPAAIPGTSGALGTRFGKSSDEAIGRAKTEQPERKLAGAEPSTNATVDVMLVAAPKLNVANCLKELQSDVTNFAGLEIDDSTAARNYQRTQADADKKSIADNTWQQFRRGRASQPRGGEEAREQHVAAESPYSFSRGEASRALQELDRQAGEAGARNQLQTNNLPQQRGRAIRVFIPPENSPTNREGTNPYDSNRSLDLGDNRLPAATQGPTQTATPYGAAGKGERSAAIAETAKTVEITEASPQPDSVNVLFVITVDPDATPHATTAKP
ncbi:MAG: hypothetical protein IT425_11860 [Pirellulales bacterium]|nr:hypothetical protein [Pirellulales bacterium]